MIKEFRVSNFKSLYKEIVLDLKIDKRSHKKNEDDNSYFRDNNISKVLSIYWPNASWKTTILEAMYVLANYISWNIPNLRKVRILPHILHKTENIFLGIDFFIWKILYKYDLEISSTNFSIVYERLRKVENKKHNIIFTRKNLQISIPIFTKKEENKILEKINFSPSVSVNTPLSIFLKDCENVSNYFNKLNLIKPVNIFETPMTDHTILLPKLFDELSINSKQELIKYFKKSDFTISDIVVEKQLVPWWEKYKTQFIHNEDWKEFFLSINDESYGTAQFLWYLTYFFHLKEKGWWVILIDEFDSSLHPLLLNNLLEFFISQANENIQIIFNTHDISILYEKILYKDQIWFIDKDSENVENKVFYKLSDFGWKIRDEYDWLKMYMLGELWSTPILSSLD